MSAEILPAIPSSLISIERRFSSDKNFMRLAFPTPSYPPVVAQRPLPRSEIVFFLQHSRLLLFDFSTKILKC